jgi:S-adenosylhomocysteine hydrolase
VTRNFLILFSFFVSSKIVLDCGGELAGKITPRIGVVELTQTGERNYRRLEAVAPLSFAVISVDSSRLKRIEDRLGSADGFKRALTLLMEGCFQKGDIGIVFGFGKVGIGCAEQLAELSMTCVVVDLFDSSLERAQSLGFEVA